jgi:hypothetical protein
VAKWTQDCSTLERSSPHARAQALPSNNSNQTPGDFVKTYSTLTDDANIGTDLPCTAKLFNFTRGRFVTNEQNELAQRHRKFNVSELVQHAARAVKADRCLSIKKYPDGMYNRVLLLSMDNGMEVVAKIPNPNSGQPHFTTASEVATMTERHQEAVDAISRMRAEVLSDVFKSDGSVDGQCA